MEHLFVPFGTQHQVYEYPGYDDYLGIPFLDYPNLHDRQTYLQAESGFMSRLSLARDTDRDDTPFLTTWLFCGLLQEVLGQDADVLEQMPPFRHNDFVRLAWSESGNEYVMLFDTSSLLSRLEKWAALVGPVAGASEYLYKHLRKCLTIAQNVLHRPSAKIRPEMKNILAATGDLVSVAVNLTFRHASFQIPNGMPITWPTSALVDRFMSQKDALGWCPHEIGRMPWDGGPFFPTIHYRSSITRTQPDGLHLRSAHSGQPVTPKISLAHASCLQTACQLQSVKAPQLRQLNCSCEFFALEPEDQQEMLRIINTGGIPLLQCTASEDRASFRTDVVPFQPGLKFVAISHVWSHGLGNPEANEMLLCRFGYISKAVFDCWETKGQSSDQVLFWLDTLCCPVSPAEARDQVLKTMREIYTQANYVLVLDGELVDLSITGRSQLEVGVRVLTSDWMKRLWTLQEGLLPPEVWVKFKDITFPLDSLTGIDPFVVPFNQYRVAKYVRHLLSSVRGALSSEKSLALQTWMSVEEAIRPRKVTVAADEALCLSTLMHLDTQAILQAAPSDRTESLWRAINVSDLGIPQGIVFSHSPRLQTPGFRWAPVSLLNGKADGIYKADHEPANLTEDGLVIRKKGIILRRTCLSPAFKTQLDQEGQFILEAQKSANVDYVRDQCGSWYSVGQAIDPIPADLSNTLPVVGGDQTVTEILLCNPSQTFAIVLPTTGSKTHLLRLEAHVNDVQHVSMAKSILFTNQLLSTMEPAYQLAQRLAVSAELQNLNFWSMTTTILEGAAEAADVPETRERYVAEGFTKERFKSVVVSNTALILAGFGILEGVMVRETQAWCFT